MAVPVRESLAQYFTPAAVVRFAFDALHTLGMPEPQSVLDPACGDGAFLVEARRRFPGTELWGTDVDASLAAGWREVGLDGPRDHMAVRDGLTDGNGRRAFDLVVGNPPYGLGMARPKRGEPIEVQFLRRFVAHTCEGGWIAVVVPEGVLANKRLQRIRDEVLGAIALRAVVTLPEGAFAATKARTALLVGRRALHRGDVLVARPDGKPDLGAYLDGVLARLAEGTGG